MKSFALSSGSSGNCFYIESIEGVGVLVDCGLTVSRIEELLARKKRSLENVKAVFITHEHSDHVAGLESLMKQRDIPIYLSKGTANALSMEEGKVILVKHHQMITVQDMNIFCVSKPHDAEEPLSFVLNDGMKKVGVFTDLGHVPDELKLLMKVCDVLYIEANYDEDTAKNSGMHYVYVNRLLSDTGHLSLHECMDVLKEITHDKQKIIITHVSENVNSYVYVYSQAKEILSLAGKLPEKLLVSFQGEATPWVV